MTFKGTIKIEREENWVVATCLENNIASQGKTIDEAPEAQSYTRQTHWRAAAARSNETKRAPRREPYLDTFLITKRPRRNPLYVKLFAAVPRFSPWYQ
jgi:hypothetical protein